jgi:predicted transcriptional regulator
MPGKATHRSGLSVEQLPDAELDVLACLWRLGGATVREVRDSLKSFRPMTHGAAGALLSRLEAKGLVVREKAPVGKAFVYRPAHEATDGYQQVVTSVLERVFGGSSVALVNSLLQTRRPTPDELEKLRELLETLSREEQK